MKKIGIFYIDLGDKKVENASKLMIASVKDAIPGAHLVQFTIPKSPVLPDIDEVVSLDPSNIGFMELRMHHFASYPHDQMLFLDPDIIVQANVWDVFDTEFDVALTDRGKACVISSETGEDLRSSMPHNTGVMFSTGNAFWKRVCADMKKMSEDNRNWFGDQIAVGQVATSNVFNIKILDGDAYNYSPKRRDEDVSSRLIVHYKGNRKAWMVSA